MGTLLIDSEQAVISPKQLRVLYELGQEESQKQIARTLAIEPSTVKSHVDNIYLKLGCHNAAGAVFLACERGLIKWLPCVLC